LCLALAYQEIMRSQDPKFAVRYQIVLSALSKGIRPTMRAFRCSRHTVRLWLRRYQEQGLAGLEERSRAPHHIPHKTPPEVERPAPTSRDRCSRPATPSPALGRAPTGRVPGA